MIVKVTPHQRETITGPCSPFGGGGGGGWSLFPSSSGRKHFELRESGLPVLGAGGVRQSRGGLLPALSQLPVS